MLKETWIDQLETIFVSDNKNTTLCLNVVNWMETARTQVAIHEYLSYNGNDQAKNFFTPTTLA